MLSMNLLKKFLEERIMQAALFSTEQMLVSDKITFVLGQYTQAICVVCMGRRMESRQERAVRLFKEGYNCSQSVFAAFCDLYGIDEETALKIAASFGAGMGRMREVCGAVSGMFLVAGLETGTTEGKDSEGKKKNYDTVQFLAEKFKEKNGSIVCRELLGLEQKKENPFKDTKPEERTEKYYKKRPCVEMVRDAAQLVEEYLVKK